MTGKIEVELKRLQDEGTIEPVQFSEWAAPIVSILKLDDSIRIRGNYKSTVNQVSKLDSYPISKVEDLLATLQCWLTTSKEQVCVHGTASNLRGPKVSKEGIQPLDDKVDAITNVPASKNVSKLKSYFGMINYY